MTQYTVKVNDKTYGPYPENVLAEWVAAGKVTADTLVQAYGGVWQPAKDWIRDLAMRQVAAPSTPPALPESPGKRPPPVPRNGDSSGKGTGQRDRVVIIGRRQSGKTIFLASVYARLWRSLNGMTAKAVSGIVHQQLIDTYATLQRGQWPAATLDTLQIDLDIEHAGTRRRMVTLDFAGEMFRKAFVEEQHDFPGVRDLVDHIDRAIAVLLLVDPAVAAGANHEAAMEDDFGIVQAVQRIRTAKDGEDVPIALVLTKADQHQGLIDRFGAASGFVRHHFPALVRTLKQLPIFQISAVQTDRAADGTFRPRPDSSPINVEAPLQFCLDRIEAVRQQAEAEEQEVVRVREQQRLDAAERSKDRTANIVLFTCVALILLAGAAVIVWILVHDAN